jgi:hypothetical protein
MTLSLSRHTLTLPLLSLSVKSRDYEQHSDVLFLYSVILYLRAEHTWNELRVKSQSRDSNGAFVTPKRRCDLCY